MIPGDTIPRAEERPREAFVESGATRAEKLFEPGSIGGLEIRNRLIRAGTSESMAGDGGEITPELTDLYETLARNEVGAIFTGHLYCDPRGQYATNQTGIYEDRLIPGLTEFANRVGGTAPGCSPSSRTPAASRGCPGSSPSRPRRFRT